MLSIVIPTFNERDNVEKIVNRIKAVLTQKSYEIIFVDDSTDNTPDFIKKVAKKNPEVKYFHRENEKGLGTAIVKGFSLAGGEVLTVMDSDLQHPPELLLQMLTAIEKGADIVIPSRFIPGGNDGGLDIIRKIISSTARYIGKIALSSLRKITDPTGGFFMFKKAVIDKVELKPIGWKIMIEVLVRGNYQRIIEIPYRFDNRAAGESKMSFHEQWNYLRHLAKLAKDSPQDRRFFSFALVGLSGVFVNMLVYAILVNMKIPVVLSGIFAAIIAMLSNYILNSTFTWPDRNQGTWYNQMIKFIITSGVGIAISTTILALCYHKLGIHYLVANGVGILGGLIWNYTLSKLWVWKPAGEFKPIIVERWPA